MNLRDLPVPHEDGSWVNERVSRICEMIHDYDSRLEVAWIPPARREPGDYAFEIRERLPSGEQVVAFSVATEDEMNEHVLARIVAGDKYNSGSAQDRFEALERARKLEQQKRTSEQLEEAHDKARFFIRTPLHRVRMGNGRSINL
jgi:hypothetical protein